MEIKFGVVHGGDLLKQLVGGLLGGQEEHEESCPCIECTADRIAKGGMQAGPPEGTYDAITAGQLKGVVERVQRAEEAASRLCARLYEKPMPKAFGDALYQMRVEEYNARVRCVHALVATLSPTAREGLPTVPEPLSDEQARERRDKVGLEIEAAVEARKAAAVDNDAGSVTPELEALLDAILKKGRSKEDMAAKLSEAAERLRGYGRSTTEEQPSPSAA